MLFPHEVSPPPRIHAFESAPSERLRLMARAADLLANGTDYEKTLDFVASLLVSSLATWCTIDLVNENGKIERVGVAHRDQTKSSLMNLMHHRYPASPTAKGGVYRVIETREPIIRPVITRDDWARRADDPQHLDMIMELGSSSYMCVPLIARGRVVGACVLCSGERVYGEEELETALELARLIAMAVDNVSMYRRMSSTLAELERTHHQLVQSSKLAALGVISAGIAHEINNPLTVIRCYLAHLESLFAKGKPPTKWEFSYFADKMNASIDRIVRIVNNVKEFSRRSDRLWSTFDVRAALEASLGLLDERLRFHRIRIERDLSETELTVEGDQNRLEQVFVNVLTNAKDAIVARHHVGGRLFVSARLAKGRVRVCISDDGAGMKKEDRVRVFEPFFTTKEAGRGTGLGMSISLGIVQDHRGTIEIDSIEGRGTAVTIELPQFEGTRPSDV